MRPGYRILARITRAPPDMYKTPTTPYVSRSTTPPKQRPFPIKPGVIRVLGNGRFFISTGARFLLSTVEETNPNPLFYWPTSHKIDVLFCVVQMKNHARFQECFLKKQFCNLIPLMEEILHKLRLVVYPFILQGFLHHQQYSLVIPSLISTSPRDLTSQVDDV